MQKDNMKKRPMLRGKIEEIIYAQLEAGEDLLRALWDICRQNDVKTGILLDATGSMAKVRIQRYPHEPREGGIESIDFVEIPGPLEVSAHGIIGIGWVPVKSVTPSPALTRGGGHTGFGAGGWEGHESPYLHVHITVSSASQTVCGHLMEGSLLNLTNHNGKADVPSHFTVAIAKVSEVILRATFDKSGYYHDLIRA
ncbi:DNA-binding protein [Bradyrhizobium sp. 137]|uniref:PPC domain-containing DNA-binding protein n=1 Tax=Bradyrhizobium sp. 137 TaxID=2782614 RepID=UPI001FF7A7D6|nr:PPC domain-containing DNA-binding protein [Bradyrhizobium sp. 137]MCK1758977.1 DNA-binding protein [Bradyrhizobium sp. 137]